MKDMSMQIKYMCVQTMYIKEVLDIDNMIFKPLEDLKKVKYKKIEIFKDGWQKIMLGAPPKGQEVVKELKEIQNYIETATDEQKQQYINCDEDASYYIKQYMEDHDLDYEEDNIEYIEEQCSPIIRHYKNHFNRARPYQVADKLKMDLDRFNTETSKSPSYPSGHTVQPFVVAEIYSRLYPQHRAGLMKGAKICGFGRVLAGLHYPSDYEAGVKLAKELGEYLDYDIKEDAPVNSTGAGISMAPTALGKKKKKKKFDIYTR